VDRYVVLQTASLEVSGGHIRDGRSPVPTVMLKTIALTNLIPNNIDLQLTAPGREEEVEAWNDVFGIAERFKAKFCGKNDRKAWLQQVTQEGAYGDMTSEQLLALTLRAADRFPYDSANFLKEPFLTACKDARII
jgi:hypothetical protein